MYICCGYFTIVHIQIPSEREFILEVESHFAKPVYSPIDFWFTDGNRIAMFT